MKTNNAKIDDLSVNYLTVNNLQINIKSGSIVNNYTTIIEKSRKIQCNIKEIVDNQHDIVKSKYSELLYFGINFVLDTRDILKTFKGNVYHRYRVINSKENKNGIYSILTYENKGFFSHMIGL